jgi:MFS family permease
MGSFNVMPSYSSYFKLTTTTKSLNTAVSYVGGCAISFISGPWTDWRGRREAIFWSALITLVGGVIQGASQNIEMFIAGRLIVGFGMGLAQTSTPTLLAETVPVQYRGFAMGLYYACWGVGTLFASGVCYGTQTLATHPLAASSCALDLVFHYPLVHPRITALASCQRKERGSVTDSSHCERES